MTATTGRVLVPGTTGVPRRGGVSSSCSAAATRWRTTIRDARGADRVRAGLRALALDVHLDPVEFDAVEFVEADLSADRGWADAVRDCAGVLHVASPFPVRPPRDPDDLLMPRWYLLWPRFTASTGMRSTWVRSTT